MENDNNLDWKKYEFITKYIYETLGQQYHINIQGYGNDCKITGKSGVQHQIDVLTSETDDTGTYRTAIECKYWNKKVNKDIVMKLLAIIQDTDIKRGIIVSKSGYTPDAQQFARYNNILIVHLREVETDNKENKKELQIADLHLHIKINTKRPEITNIIVTDLDDNIITLHEKDQYRILIENPNWGIIKLFHELMLFRDCINEQKPFKTITKKYDHQQSILHMQNTSVKIKSITYTGLLSMQDTNQTKVFSIVDKVWLIMEKIFEEQTFIITKGGMIVQNLNREE